MAQIVEKIRRFIKYIIFVNYILAIAEKTLLRETFILIFLRIVSLSIVAETFHFQATSREPLLHTFTRHNMQPSNIPRYMLNFSTQATLLQAATCNVIVIHGSWSERSSAISEFIALAIASVAK